MSIYVICMIAKVLFISQIASVSIARETIPPQTGINIRRYVCQARWPIEHTTVWEPVNRELLAVVFFLDIYVY